KEEIRNTKPATTAIQCNLPGDLPTTLPARCVLGRTWNAVGASTNAKKIKPPIQTTSDSSIRKRRKDMTENYSDVCCPAKRRIFALPKWVDGAGILSPRSGRQRRTSRRDDLDGNGDVLDDVFEYLIGLFRFLQRRCVESIHDDAVRED